MRSLKHTTVVAASAEQVWSVLSDVERWPDWAPTVTAAEPLDDPSLRVGARYKLIQPKLPPAVWTVTALEPRRRFTWHSESTGVRVTADHLVAPSGEGAATVTLEISFAGPLARLALLAGGKLTREYMALEAASLKETAEARAAQ